MEFLITMGVAFVVGFVTPITLIIILDTIRDEGRIRRDRKTALELKYQFQKDKRCLKSILQKEEYVVVHWKKTIGRFYWIGDKRGTSLFLYREEMDDAIDRRRERR